MPPAITDDERSDSEAEEIPFREKTQTAKVEEDDDNNDRIANDEDEEGDDDEGGEEEYVVEKIITHAFDYDGTLKFEVKWMGYDKKSDHTWEPEENLEGAKDLLTEYYEKVGGKPKFAPKKSTPGEKKRKAQSASSTPAETKGTGRGRKKTKTDGDSEATPEVSSQRNGKEDKWEPPKGSWDDEVMNIDALEELPNPNTGERERYAFVVWNNGRKTHHQIRVIHQKAPQKMLRYYEQHLVFRGPTTS